MAATELNLLNFHKDFRCGELVGSLRIEIASRFSHLVVDNTISERKPSFSLRCPFYFICMKQAVSIANWQVS